MSNNHGPGYAKHPEHRIALASFNGRVLVEVGGEVIADSLDALRLDESSYPPVYYLPRRDVRMDRLVRTDHHTYCPFKGDASYFGIQGGADDAVWCYEHPYDEVLAIRERLAFYPKKVDALRVLPAEEG